MSHRSIGSNIRLIALFNFLSDFVPFAPVAIIYFARVAGSYTLGMSIFAIAYVSAAVFEIPTGVLSDRVGRKYTLVLGAVFSTACIICYALADSYIVLLLGGLLQGIGRAFYSGNNEALLYDTLYDMGKEGDYHSYLGRTSAMFQAALAIAGVLGSAMTIWSLSAVMWISVVPQIASLLVGLCIREPHRHWSQSANAYTHLLQAIGIFRSNASLRILTLASSVRFALEETSYFLRSAFYQTLWPLWAFGITSIITHISAGMSFYFAGKVIDRYGPLKTLNIGIVVKSVMSFVALLLPSRASPAIMSATSLTYGVGVVSANTLLQRQLSSAERATMISLHSLAGSIAFGIASVCLGIMADRVGIIGSLIILHCVFVIPLVLYQRAYKG